MHRMAYGLLKNVHRDSQYPDSVFTASISESSVSLLSGTYDYYHYCCDGFQDRGWGCGYRTLQTICSWIINARRPHSEQLVAPQIPFIQKILVDLGDKPQEFYGSSNWIGTMEVGYVLNHLYDIDFRLIHIPGDGNWQPHIAEIAQHFREGGCPIMMGGKSDASSKCVVGTFENSHLLIVDPHFVGQAKNAIQLQTQGYVRWYSVEEFVSGSDDFYNLCVPQIKTLHP